jgi:hypothetical protein
MVLRPNTGPRSVTKTAFWVKSVAKAAASLLFNPSSTFLLNATSRLAQLRIRRIHLLGKGWQSKTDCQSYKCYQ